MTTRFTMSELFQLIVKLTQGASLSNAQIQGIRACLELAYTQGTLDNLHQMKKISAQQSQDDKKIV